VKFTDEELSRILSAHEGGQLSNGFHCSQERGRLVCAIQAARPSVSLLGALDVSRWFVIDFDFYYSRCWSADELLRWLEGQGAA
jgi:hypothetical protein